jgi:RimJ/RimL family protein N-acetyltransferase
MQYLFYKRNADNSHETSQREFNGIPDAGYAFLWRPTLSSIMPPGANGGKSWALWWGFHWLRVFGNREYSVCAIICQGKVVHRSGVFPRYFRFPFMDQSSLQIGDTWTDPEYRGKGLAVRAIQEVVQHYGVRRDLWYVVEKDNTASIRVIEKVGFSLVGIGGRSPRFGIRVLGKYHIDNFHPLDSTVPPRRSAVASAS